jgi:LmbE family N-acetylglucosaminyl deacetylase
MKKILVIAAHPDDELLGCGGSLLYYRKLGYKIKVVFLSDGESSRKENNKKIKKLILKRIKQAELVSRKCSFIKPTFGGFPDNKLDTVPLLDIVQFIEKKIQEFKPEIIFTHFENDLNIDHHLTFKAVITATRPLSKTFVKKILSFEIPSSTESNFTKNSKKIFNPNFFIDISKFVKKKSLVLKIYKSELRPWPHPRSIKAIENLSKYRGSQIGIKYAEAFIVIRELK